MFCDNCESLNNIIIDNNAYICDNCGCVILYKNDETLTYTKITNNYNFKKMFYKRKNYLNNLLSFINGFPFDNNDLKKEEMNKIINQLKNESCINYKMVRTLLKKNHLSTYYKHTNYICDIVNNNSKIYINNDMKKKILYEFIKFERFYEKNKLFNRKRKIISYSFLLEKIFKKLGYNHIINDNRLNKLITKQIYYENIWHNNYKQFESL